MRPLAKIGVTLFLLAVCCGCSGSTLGIPDPVGQYEGAGGSLKVAMVLDAGGHGSATWSGQSGAISSEARFHGALGFGFIRFRSEGFDDWVALISYSYSPTLTGVLLGSGFDGASFDVAKISAGKQPPDPPGPNP